MDDLKPCPFCGGGAKLWKAFPLSETPWCIDIEHVGDCFMVHADQMCRRTEADAIAAWNARATATPDTAGLVDRLTDEADLCRNDGADDIAELPTEAATALTTQAAENARRDTLLHEALQLLDANIRSKTRDDNAEQQLHVKIRRSLTGSQSHG